MNREQLLAAIKGQVAELEMSATDQREVYERLDQTETPVLMDIYFGNGVAEAKARATQRGT